MALTIGTQLGSHEIIALLGKGGMGEVYRARDTKLKREVAIKVLPEEFSRDSDRVARFQREAEVLASLSHPNIAAIHSLEEEQGARFLVLELVEGETLDERIQHGPIPVDEALTIAKSTCDALEAAHEQGVVHRDLKPANIKITPDGKVKVLDFGLAKAMSGDAQPSSFSNSPTLSLAATQAGVILGTANYMSPEQAKGKSVDRRADIWAFGVVVYEMLTGARIFGGETVAETMAQVMMKEPNWAALPATTPARLRDLLRRCLTKDPRNRIRDIGDVRIAIEEIIANPEAEASKEPVRIVPESKRPWNRAIPWLIIAALAISLVVMGWAVLKRQSPSAPMRLTAELGADVSLNAVSGAAAFLSPDGKTLAFIAAKGATQTGQIYVRRLDQLQALPLSGTDGARAAFFSPDGQWIAYFSGGKLKKISVNGGAAVTLCDAEDDRGGTWADDGSIIFTANTRSGLFRVSSAGGKPEPVTELDQASNEVTQRWPYVLPGSQVVLFISSPTFNNYENANIIAQSLRTGERKIVQRGGYYPRYVSSGHLLYLHQGTLFAVPFDPAHLDVTGQPVPVLERVTSSPVNGSSQFAFSENGTLAYLADGQTGSGTSILWMDANGKTQPLRLPLAHYSNPRFSPDGRRIAFEVADQQYDVWIYEWERDIVSRLTFDPTQDSNPVWTPDGKRIAFSSRRADRSTGNLYWQRADGTDEPQRLTESKYSQSPMSWHPSGKFLAFTENRPQTLMDIMILPMEGDETSGWKPGEPAAFLATPFNESDPAFSPDGRWLAYDSSEAGHLEVYVRPFPGPGGKWQISTAGGGLPTWSKNGKELFYRTPDSRIMVATYKAEGDTFRADKPRLWSEGQFVDRGGRNFDLHPDGQRFAVTGGAETQAQTKLDKITFIFNFFDELRRIAPPSKK